MSLRDDTAVLDRSVGQICPQRNWDCQKLAGHVSAKLAGLGCLLVAKSNACGESFLVSDETEVY